MNEKSGIPQKRGLGLGIVCSSTPEEVFICVVGFFVLFFEYMVVEFGWGCVAKIVKLSWKKERRKKQHRLGHFSSLQVSANNSLYVLASLSLEKTFFEKKDTMEI